MACTGDNAGDAVSDAAAEAQAAEALAAWKEGQRVADSLFAAAPTVQDVQKMKGDVYDVADDSLATLVRREAEKTRTCYTNALRDHDPNLSGTVYMLVNFGAAGWDLVRAEHSVWSSPVGRAVDGCLNATAKSTWQLPTKGVKPGAHLVQLTFRPDSLKDTGRRSY
jgi:hypothetical protein